MTTLAVLASVPALAGEHSVAPVTDSTLRKECGQCHMAFQPGLLPAVSWEKMMDNLANHFGEDASVAPAKAAQIRQVLVSGAGRVRRGGVPERITTAPWFVHEHNFPDRVWKRPEVVSKSNCPACHRGAEQGFYDDD